MRSLDRRRRSRTDVSFVTLLPVCALLGLIVLIAGSYPVRAMGEFSWLRGIITVTDSGKYETELTDDESSRMAGCDKQKVVLADKNSAADLCVVQGDRIRIGYELDNGQTPYVGFASDAKMYPMNKWYGYRLTLVPGTDMVLSARLVLPSYNWQLTAYQDAAAKLTAVRGSLGQTVSYQLDYDTPDYVLNRHLLRVRLSDNNRWLGVSTRSEGLVRIDLGTFEEKYFSTQTTDLGWGGYWIDAQISDDGTYAAVGGYGSWPAVYALEGCGAESYEKLRTTRSLECPKRDLYPELQGKYANGDNEIADIRFDTGGGEISFLYGDRDNRQMQRAMLRIEGYNPPRLDYLALGDSYSSGEGDTEVAGGRKYYRAFTDVSEDVGLGYPREKCHISTRSYPYLLADYMKLGASEWNTVACSGAMTKDIGGSNDRYLGQGYGDMPSGRLGGYPFEGLKYIGLNEFIPGRNKQIEFVRKYKPKVITLTVGGNDVEFGDVMNVCAIYLDTCRYAQPDGRRSNGNKIKGQFNVLKRLYADLYVASDKTAKIYVLGYPQFISDEFGIYCQANIGLLSGDERQMIVQGVTYMNTVIKAAAKAAGVEYVDTESALAGGRLCEPGPSYVTGAAFIAPSELQESFHPNAQGNKAMADAVMKDLGGKFLKDYTICPQSEQNACPDETVVAPEPPAFFGPAGSTKNVYVRFAKWLQKEVKQRLSVPTYSFKPDSIVRAVLYSDPTDLGELTATAEGGLEADVAVPSTVPAGYHTLVLTGESYSGEPIEYTQVVEVRGANPGDKDDNGVPDTQQQCLYVPMSGIDEDKDGIDDACDPVIGAPPWGTDGADPASGRVPGNTTAPTPRVGIRGIGVMGSVPKHGGKENASIVREPSGEPPGILGDNTQPAKPSALPKETLRDIVLYTADVIVLGVIGYMIVRSRRNK